MKWKYKYAKIVLEYSTLVTTCHLTVEKLTYKHQLMKYDALPQINEPNTL